MDFKKFKKFFIFSLIGGLIVSALVAAIIVIIGEFNEITWRVLGTLAMVILHSLISLFFIWNDERKNTFDKLSFFIDVLFFLIVASFLTSIFGIWKIISAETILNLYQSYFVIGFASLHGDVLSKALHKEKYIDAIVYANYVFIAIVSLMLFLLIYVNNSFEVLGEMFLRILGAIGIIDGTLSVLTIIFYRLYAHKHPVIVDQPEQKTKKGLSIWVWILIIYLFIQVGFTAFSYLFRSF